LGGPLAYGVRWGKTKETSEREVGKSKATSARLASGLVIKTHSLKKKKKKKKKNKKKKKKKTPKKKKKKKTKKKKEKKK